MLAIFLITLSAALHAAWNFAVRRHGNPRVASALLVAGSVAITFPLALAHSPEGWLRVLPWGVGAGLGEAAYFLTLARALEIGPLAAVYTVSRAASMLVVWPVSHLVLKEAVGPRQLCALAGLVVGLWLLAPSRKVSPGTEPQSGRGYLWALVCGLCIAGYQLVYKGAVDAGSDPLQLFSISMATSLPVVILALPGSRALSLRLALRVRPGVLAFGTIAMTTSFLLSLWVMRTHGAGWVMTMRNSSVAFAQLFGWALLGERPSLRAGAGVALVFADAVLLGTG